MQRGLARDNTVVIMSKCLNTALQLQGCLFITTFCKIVKSNLFNPRDSNSFCLQQSHLDAGEQVKGTMLSNKVFANACDKFVRHGGDCKRAFPSNTPHNVRVAAAGYDAAQSGTSNDSLDGFEVGRRQALAALVTVPAILQANAALAVQGLTAGRIPGKPVYWPVAFTSAFETPVAVATCSQLGYSVTSRHMGGLCGCSVCLYALLSLQDASNEAEPATAAAVAQCIGMTDT